MEEKGSRGEEEFYMERGGIFWKEKMKKEKGKKGGEK